MHVRWKFREKYNTISSARENPSAFKDGFPYSSTKLPALFKLIDSSKKTRY